MAHQNVAAPAAVLIGELTATRNFFTRIGTFFENAMVRMIERSPGNARLEAVRALQNLSDAELAELKIKRDDIVAYVFKDFYYI